MCGKAGSKVVPGRDGFVCQRPVDNGVLPGSQGGSRTKNNGIAAHNGHCCMIPDSRAWWCSKKVEGQRRLRADNAKRQGDGGPGVAVVRGSVRSGGSVFCLSTQTNTGSREGGAEGNWRTARGAEEGRL